MENIELDIKEMAFGIGRKLTDEELIKYLSREKREPVNLKDAFSKYISQK